MVIITTDAWAAVEEKQERGRKEEETQERRRKEEEKKPPSETPSQNLFGFQDLASDYYQVLRQPSRPAACKLIWGVVVSVFLVITCYMVYQLIHAYLQYNSFNSAGTVWEGNITLPAITVCSTNFVNYTALKSALENTNFSAGVHDDEEAGHLLDDFDAFMDALARDNGSASILSTLDIWVLFWDIFEWEHYEGSIATTYGNVIQTMIIGEFDYSFANKGTYIANHAEVTLPTELGTCFEINDNSAMQQSYNGVSGGFTIDLDAHVDGYLPTTATKGFVVFIRDQDESVMLNQGGYIIAPGAETFMKLSARDVTRLPSPWGTCENVESQYSRYSSVHYETVRECGQRQKIQLMIELCGCIPWYFANRMYTLNKIDILTEAVRVIEEAEAERTNTREEEPTPTEEPVDSRNRKSRMKTRFPMDEGDRELIKANFMSARRSLHEFEKSEGNSERDSEGPTDAGNYYTTSSGPWWVTDQPITDTDFYPYVCSFSLQLICQNTIEFYLRLNDESFKMEDCPEPCTYHEWSVETSSTVYPPTEEYYNRFIKGYIETAPPFEYAKNNIARLHIYYDDIKMNKIEQQSAYEIQNVIAELGGTVDLFIGFSFFTIIQLCEIGLAVCVRKCCGRRKENRDVAEVAENRLAQI